MMSLHAACKIRPEQGRNCGAVLVNGHKLQRVPLLKMPDLVRGNAVKGGKLTCAAREQKVDRRDGSALPAIGEAHPDRGAESLGIPSPLRVRLQIKQINEAVGLHHAIMGRPSGGVQALKRLRLKRFDRYGAAFAAWPCDTSRLIKEGCP